MHPEALAGAAAMLAQVVIAENPRCLDLGGQDVNGTARHLIAGTWDVLDIEAGAGVTIVADGTAWRTDDPYDVVLSTEMLEHVEQWRAVLDTAAAALKPGGVLILTCASDGRWPHGATGAPAPADGEWYANVSPDRLAAELAARFTQSHVTYQYPPGDAYAWAVA